MADKLITTRRFFLTGAVSLLCAPALVRATSLDALGRGTPLYPTIRECYERHSVEYRIEYRLASSVSAGRVDMVGELHVEGTRMTRLLSPDEPRVGNLQEEDGKLFLGGPSNSS